LHGQCPRDYAVPRATSAASDVLGVEKRDVVDHLAATWNG
jgi:hypothetical protein